ncbi:MAG TPA: AAA family ATPase, partial [Lachnospiraceae bacterium]|nr:AAA family ATPase [Lachnospiraceae bacterium]
LYVGGSSYRSDIAHEKMGKMKTFFAIAESSQTENIIEQTGTKTI